MKNFNKLFRLCILTFALVYLQGCDDYFDLNDNPNLVQAPPINALLSTATHKSGLTSRSMANTVSNYTQYLASPVASSPLDTYQITDATGVWDQIYLAMADIYDFKMNAINVNSSEHLGVANVLLAYNLGLVADVFGSVPYSEAFGGVLNPIYDSEESVYNEALSLLSEAIVELRKTDSAVRLGANEDLIHGGSREAWLKTAYAFQARLLNKISKKPNYNPQSVLAALDNSYTSNNDDAGMGTFIAVNPWAQVAISNANALLGGWLSENFVNHLNGETYGLFDPRIEQITDLTVNGVYVGTRNGEGNRGPGANTIKDECYISVNSPWTNRESKLWIVTYAELKFIEAEAALRANNRPRAYAAYLAGINANMQKLLVDPAKAQAYINDPIVSVGESNLTIDLIFKEKYVTTYLNAEAWNDARRHNYQYKDFRLPLNAEFDQFIRRVAYPVGELSKNGSNVPDEVPLFTPLWWDN